MTGIVLCGGQSTRMGTDKGLLPSSTGNWAQAAIDKLLGLKLPVALSINAGQYPAYSTIFPAIELIIDSPELPLAGPLLALLTIHEQKPTEDLLILACDMILIQPRQLDLLVLHHRLHPIHDAYVFSNDDALEPLCGLYTAGGIARLMDRLRSGTLKRFSMKHALEQLNTCSIPIPNEEKVCFSNLNFPPPDQTPASP